MALLTALACASLAAALLSGPAAATFPGANGKIAYTRATNGDEDIYVMNTDGSGQTNLTNNPADDITAAWSPDGSQIAFASDRDGDLDIYVMEADGSGVTRLTNDPGADCCPAWSPDGSQIAFTSGREGSLNVYVLDIYVMDADGSNVLRLTDNDRPTFDGDPNWSPDGSQIAFATNRDGNEEIYVMNADGSDQTRLTNDPAVDRHPVWSPNGSQIVFGRQMEEFDVFVMNANGSGVTNLRGDVRDMKHPVWAPDGTLILFDSNRSAVGLWVMKPDGSDVTLLIDGPAPEFDADWQRLVESAARPPPAQLPGTGGERVTSERASGWAISALAVVGGAAMAAGCGVLQMRRGHRPASRSRSVGSGS